MYLLSPKNSTHTFSLSHLVCPRPRPTPPAHAQLPRTGSRTAPTPSSRFDTQLLHELVIGEPSGSQFRKIDKTKFAHTKSHQQTLQMLGGNARFFPNSRGDSGPLYQGSRHRSIGVACVIGSELPRVSSPWVCSLSKWRSRTLQGKSACEAVSTSAQTPDLSSAQTTQTNRQ